ncbi:MAG: threonylcarbamoyl-AMP synthase [Akkermansiaceae bacterium]|nr:threonylcarbamoyl-AMP synthase [Akkermansia sp.]MCD7799240.1 threonylcarbamoyl-AMP synthase [Akkermansiaceae bacterium]
METEIIEINPLENARPFYQKAAELLASGGLTAIPTETVYGLGADAFQPDAVAAVFAVKERPSFDPLILHLSNARQLDEITEVPEALRETVDALAGEFWPGPMTLVLPKKGVVPDIATSGLPTVAVRVSAHPVMRGVCKALGHPVAAPSANRFGHISPTSAEAVKKELGGRIPLILDAGACSEGLESTILFPLIDDRGKPAVRILRHGPVTRERLRGVVRVLKNPRLPASGGEEDDERPAAPGQLTSHYAPSKPLILVDPKEPFEARPGESYGLISYKGDSPLARQDCWAAVISLSPGSGRLAEAAVRLFAVMRRMDETPEVDVIVAESLPETGLGVPMMDRLRRAAAQRV